MGGMPGYQSAERVPTKPQASHELEFLVSLYISKHSELPEPELTSLRYGVLRVTQRFADAYDFAGGSLRERGRLAKAVILLAHNSINPVDSQSTPDSIIARSVDAYDPHLIIPSPEEMQELRRIQLTTAPNGE